MSPFPVAPGPQSAVRCTACGERVQARYASESSTRYVLPVDEQGRCTDCVWMDGAADEMVPTGQVLHAGPWDDR